MNSSKHLFCLSFVNVNSSFKVKVCGNSHLRDTSAKSCKFWRLSMFASFKSTSIPSWYSSFEYCRKQTKKSFNLNSHSTVRSKLPPANACFVPVPLIQLRPNCFATNLFYDSLQRSFVVEHVVMHLSFEIHIHGAVLLMLRGTDRRWNRGIFSNYSSTTFSWSLNHRESRLLPTTGHSLLLQFQDFRVWCLRCHGKQRFQLKLNC